MTNDRDRAAELADEMGSVCRHLTENGCLGLTAKIETADLSVIAAALRAYSAQPVAPDNSTADLKINLMAAHKRIEKMEKERRQLALQTASEGLREAMGRAIYEAPGRWKPWGHLDDAMTAAFCMQADAALSAIHSAGYVISTREPTEAQRLAFETQPGNWFDKMRAALAAGECQR